jgi:carbon storage regulator
MLVLTRRPVQKVMIGDTITVTVLAVEGQHVRLGFKAPPDIPIHREEIYLAIQAEQQKLAPALGVRLRRSSSSP